MLLSAIVSEDKRVFKFSVPKLRGCENLLHVVNRDAWGNITVGPEISTPSLLLMLDKTDDPALSTCKISYDETLEPIEVPQALMSFAYSDLNGFSIPVVWSRVLKTCEIEITFTKAIDSRVVLKYDAIVANPTTDFWMSGMIQLESEQVLEIKGSSAKVLVEFWDSFPIVHDCLTNGSVNVAVTTAGKPAFRRWGQQLCESVMDFSLASSRSFFLKAVRPARVQIYSKSATPLTIITTPNRNVVLVYEMTPAGASSSEITGNRLSETKSTNPNVQELSMCEPLPEWKGQTVLYRWSDKPREFLKVASWVTHVRIPGYLSPKQQAQLASLFGVSVEQLQDLIHVSTGKEIAVCL